MAAFKFVCKGEEKSFSEGKAATIAASKTASKENKILEVVEEKEGEWVVHATVYPNGEVRYPVDIGKFADALPVRRKRV